MSLPPVERASDYMSLAQARLNDVTWRYLMDGDGAGNERALADVRLMPRPLSAVVGGHTRLRLFGQDLAHPFLLAPVAYQRLFHADGEVATAMAAAAQGGQQVISSLASTGIKAIVRAAVEGEGLAPWFQLYWQRDRQRTQRLLRKAVDAGCSAIVFTVDAPVKLATMPLPADIHAVNLEAQAHTDMPAEGGSLVFDRWMAQAPSWDDVAWLRQQTALPLLIKGVLHPDDAARALDLGCDGLIVSNHGGRVLEGTALSLAALPRVVARVAGRAPVLFDSGVRGGRDALVGMAHGATAVLLGRPYVWGLASHGALGVAHVIRLMRDELEMTMALTGCATLADVNASRLA